MSKVTNLILTCSVSEKEDFIESEISKFKIKDTPINITSIHDKMLPSSWYGGSKNMECNVFIGAYNYLDLNSFISHLKSIKWEDPEIVQLFVLEDHEDMFKKIDLFES